MLFVPCLPMPSTERHLPNRRSAKPRLNAMATDSASESREREFASHSLSNDVMTSLAGINDKRLRLLVSAAVAAAHRSEEHTSELQSLMRSSYAVFCLKKKKNKLSTQEQELRHDKSAQHM